MKAIPDGVTLKLTMQEAKFLLKALYPIAKAQSPLALNEEEIKILARMYNQIYSICLFEDAHV